MLKFIPNALLKAFNKLPLWGKIATPIVAILALSFIWSTIKALFWVIVLVSLVVGVISLTNKTADEEEKIGKF
ncbi:MAG: hypothetical protein AAF824_04415 [Bacteroidota bacterium]